MEIQPKEKRKDFHEVFSKNSIEIQPTKHRKMHGLLIIKCFEKVKKEARKKMGTSPSLTSISKDISILIQETKNIPFGYRSLYDAYKAAKKKDVEGSTLRQPKVVEALCRYLGYDNFEVFKKDNPDQEEEKDESWNVILLRWLRKTKKQIAVVGTVIVLGIIVIFIATEQCYMVWEEDHYVQVKLDLEKYNISQLKRCKTERLKNFRRIPVDCDTVFFDSSGAPRIWYGKNAEKSLEYFTSYGLHPETGKTLKPITPYMINKYVCPTKKE